MASWQLVSHSYRKDDFAMKLKTKYIGEVSVDRSKMIHFPSGLPGFQNETEFVLLNFPGELSTTFQTLQSTKSANLAFIVTNPYHFYQNYEFKLDEQIIEQLEIEQEQDVAVITIVTLKNPFEKSTMNLKAPVIINFEKRLGKQYILNTDKYETRTPLQLSVAKGDF